ncbi:MAG: hypothetical protein H0U44_12895 [Flavisolibacter sp.]|nr:hypothetical protein [Flavisolibacter sp.]
MKAFDFRLLQQQDQLDLLYQDGVYLSKRKSGKSHVLLFEFHCYYVELYYIKYRQVVSKVFCFESTEYLNPYLEEINVEELIKPLKT